MSFKKHFFIGLMLIFSQALLGQVVINEFMAANSSTINDPDFEESADWIELYNNSDEDADISLHYLTDNIDTPDKWQFPQGTIIPAKSYLIVWADLENTGLHTSFKLSSDGEEIGLFSPSLEVIDTVYFSSQKTDVSFGRYLDGESSWFWFNQPSPGFSNNSATPYLGVTYYKPSFSLDGGFYSSQQAVHISSLGGEVHYTTDGSTPTINDPIFNNEIIITETTFIRARVFQAQFIAGEVITHSYFFDDTFQERKLPVVSLVTDSEYFWSADSGLYVQNFKPEWEYPLNIEFFENDGNNRAVFNEKAGVKVNGRLSWQLPQKMLGIYFKKKYGKNDLDYPIFNDRERDSYNEIVLRAGGSDWSKTIIRDGLGQDLSQEYTPIAHQGFRPSMVFINGEYLGIHNIRSRIDEGFIESNYYMESDSYDLIENDGDVDVGSDEQYHEMNALFHTDLSNSTNFSQLESIVDIDNFTNYWVTEMWGANYSWGHNINYWKPHDGGKWQFIFADLDRVFHDPYYSITKFAIPVGDEYYNYARYWIESILENEDYAEFFVKRFNDHIYTTFHPDRVLPKIDAFSNTIQNEIPYHVDKWSGSTSIYGNGMVSVEAWEEDIEDLRAFSLERNDFMMQDLQSFFDLGPIHQLLTSCEPNNAGKIKINDFIIPSLPWNGPYFEDYSFQLSAVEKPGFNFVGWSVIKVEDLISLEEDWKYYDLGMDLGTAWREAGYDDSSWSIGQAELGYGDDDEGTVISYGDNENDKHITSYFRKSFTYSGVKESINATLRIRRDDGAIVYLNGTEIARLNLPNEGVNFETRALVNISGGNEDKLNEFELEDISLSDQNVMAVEMHQFSTSSADLSFELSFNVAITDDQIFASEEMIHVNITSDSGFLARYTPSGACLLPPEIAENTRLSIDCSPYYAAEEVVVQPSATLTIDPGVEIWFSEGVSMQVKGTILVNGTEQQHVVFKANMEDASDSWGNLLFDHAKDISYLNYLELEDATQGIHPIHHNAAISILYSDVNMNHLLLEDNFGNPIYTLHSNISLKNSILHSKITGDLINVKFGNGVIDSCVFIGNDQVDTDAIDLDGVTGGEVKNTVIKNFFGSNSDGIDLGEGSSNILIENCHISDITDKGISIGQASTANIFNNTISYCNQAVGVKDLGECQINHNTFYANAYAVAVFEKNLGAGGGLADITNSIISNSSIEAVEADSHSEASSDQNLYDTDTLIGENNIFMNPYFKNPNFSNFQLLGESPAINAASDGLNLGAINPRNIQNSKLLITDVMYHDSTNAEKEFLRIYNPSNEPVDMSAYSLSKGVSFEFPEGVTIGPKEKILVAQNIAYYTYVGGQLFEWTSGKLDNKGEKVVLTNNHGISIDHLKYLPTAPWPVVNNLGEYISLVSDSLDNHFGSNWILSQPLGIDDELKNQNTVKVFPNPCRDHLNINSKESISYLQIIDLLGNEVMQKTCSTKNLEVNVSFLKPGIYIAIINNEQRIKFIKE